MLLDYITTLGSLKVVLIITAVIQIILFDAQFLIFNGRTFINLANYYEKYNPPYNYFLHHFVILSL